MEFYEDTGLRTPISSSKNGGPDLQPEHINSVSRSCGA